MRGTVTIGIALGAALIIAGAPGCNHTGGGSGSGPIGPDPYEPNDDVPICSPISLDFLAADLTLHDPSDEDLFCFTLADDSWILVTATFVEARGDIDLQVLDAGGFPLIDSLPQQGSEMISEVLYAGDYHLRVFSPTAEVNAYALEILAQPVVIDPPPEPR